MDYGNPSYLYYYVHSASVLQSVYNNTCKAKHLPGAHTHCLILQCILWGHLVGQLGLCRGRGEGLAIVRI